MKKPFAHAVTAALYIVALVSLISTTNQFFRKETIAIPITMLGLFVLSAAVMGYLFLSEPLRLYMDGKKKEAVAFFTKVVAIFACFVILSAILILLV